MVNRKSQVEKFNARLAKREQDTQAIRKGNIRKPIDKPEHYGDAHEEGVENLMRHGDIKEAAVVFSTEGMKAFATMFSNSVNDAVEKSLDKYMETISSKIESMIESKMLQMLEGMTEGMKKFTDVTIPGMVNTQLGNSNQTLEKVVFNTEFMTEVKPETDTVEESVPDICPTDEAAVSQRILGTGKPDVDLVKPHIISYLKNNGESRLSDIMSYIKDNYGLVVANKCTTSIMNRIIKDDPNLEKVGFGTYKYEEKTFHSIF